MTDPMHYLVAGLVIGVIVGGLWVYFCVRETIDEMGRD